MSIGLQRLNTLGGGISRRSWPFILIGIFLLGAIFRLRGYDHSLPYIDHPDEPNFVLTAMWWRGENHIFQNDHYPPGYIWLEIGVQETMDLFQPPNIPDYIRALRLIAIAMNLVVALLIALTAKRLGGKMAGAIAGLVWAVSPLIVSLGIPAIPDSMVYLFVSLAFYLAVVALDHPHPFFWATASIVAGWLAILTKYQVLTALLPAGIAGLYIWWKRDRGLGRRILGAQVVISLLVLAWMLVGLQAMAPVRDWMNLGLAGVAERAETGGEVTPSQQGALERIRDVEIVRNNISYVFYPVARAKWVYWGWGIVGVGLVAGLWSFRRRKIALHKVLAWLTLLVVTISIPWLAASFRTTTVQSLRDVLPATAAAVVLWSVSLTQIVQIIVEWLQGTKFIRPYAFWLPNVALIVILFVAFFRPQLQTAWLESTWRTYPDVRVDLAEWAEASLEPGTVVVSKDNHKTFIRVWGGYQGVKWFDGDTDDITRRPVAEWRDVRGVSYAAIPYGQWRQLQNTDDGRALLDEMLLLRVFPPRAHQRGPAVAFFRLWRPQHEVAVEYAGEVRLVGYDLQPDRPAPGQRMELRLYWQPIRRPADNYSVYLHLTPADDRTDLM
ncbi:MAG: phospholipid carrier-dependent glycosyltransferase, partial [Planctomycetaceae bacterium]